MTTPQNILHSIEYKLKCLLDQFHKDVEDGFEEKTISLIDSLRDTMEDIQDIKKDMGKINDTMSLILKVLNEKNI